MIYIPVMSYQPNPEREASLKEDDCFVLHAVSKAYKWFGPKSSPHEMNMCNLHAEDIERQSHGKVTAVMALDSQDDEETFWAVLGGKGPISGGSDEATKSGPPPPPAPAAKTPPPPAPAKQAAGGDADEKTSAQAEATKSGPPPPAAKTPPPPAPAAKALEEDLDQPRSNGAIKSGVTADIEIRVCACACPPEHTFPCAFASAFDLCFCFCDVGARP